MMSSSLHALLDGGSKADRPGELSIWIAIVSIVESCFARYHALVPTTRSESNRNLWSKFGRAYDRNKWAPKALANLAGNYGA